MVPARIHAIRLPLPDPRTQRRPLMEVVVDIGLALDVSALGRLACHSYLLPPRAALTLGLRRLNLEQHADEVDDKTLER